MRQEEDVFNRLAKESGGTTRLLAAQHINNFLELHAATLLFARINLSLGLACNTKIISIKKTRPPKC